MSDGSTIPSAASPRVPRWHVFPVPADGPQPHVTTAEDMQRVATGYVPPPPNGMPTVVGLPPAATPNDWARIGPLMWERLHAWTLVADLGDVDRWLEAFATTIPCSGCRGHWLAMMAATPPAAGSHDALFEWSCARHNEVNFRLGKPILALADARTLYATDA